MGLTCTAAAATADTIHNPVRWEIVAQHLKGDTIGLYFNASIDSLWKVYAPHIATDLPLPLAITLHSDHAAPAPIEELTPPIDEYDDLFEIQVRYFTGGFALKMPVALNGSPPERIQGTIEYKSCNTKTYACVSLAHDFDEPLQFMPDKTITSATASGGGGAPLWWFFLLALAAGIAGVFTPCVFPMLPMTVSFFMRQMSRRTARRQLGAFALSIVLIYTLIGLIVTLTRSATFAAALSAHWLPNIIFFALFIIFAASFLGAFELTLPQKWTNKADARADRGGAAGAFFVALTLCIVSFSCTAPFVGALLVAAAGGAEAKPIIGMLGFGIGFALPFTLMGVFPAALKKLPKSGGWMNGVKVTFAFILIMFGMKFLAIADADFGLNLISRELFVSVWMVCLVMWGLYILGALPLLRYNAPRPEIKAGRLFAAMAAFAAAAYMSTAFVGGRLQWIEGLLPEKSIITRSHTAMPQGSPQTPSHICDAPRFADNPSLSSPVPSAYFDLKQARQCAEKQGLPLFMYFKGHSCANCKLMQAAVLADYRVIQALQSKYVVAVLYTDDRTKLPEAEWYTSDFDQKVKKTMGQQNLDYLMRRYKTNSVPFFAIEDGDSNATMGYTADAEEFLRFVGGLGIWYQGAP